VHTFELVAESEAALVANLFISQSSADKVYLFVCFSCAGF